MRWVTNETIHFDRAVSAWLIRRFVDPQAEFGFLTKSAPLPDDVIAFGVPGVELSGHDAAGTTFGKILGKYGLDDPALRVMAEVVEAVVGYVMQGVPARETFEHAPLALGVLCVAEGLMLLTATDDECLKQSMPLYDALYARIQVEQAMTQNAGRELSRLEAAVGVIRVVENARAKGSAHHTA